MNRRSLLKYGAFGTATALLSACNKTSNKDIPEIIWSAPTSFPKELDTISGTMEMFSKTIAELTDGKFQINISYGGELSPPLEILGGVQDNKFPMGYSSDFYYFTQSPVLLFGSVGPFGLTWQQQQTWLHKAGGLEILREVFEKRFNVYNINVGTAPSQMFGVLNKKIESIADLEGIKFRTSGIAAKILTRMGMTAQVVSASETVESIKSGALDGGEWVGIYDDYILGLLDVGNYYYYPSPFEPATSASVYINKTEWDKLPPKYKYLLEVASVISSMDVMTKYNYNNMTMLERVKSEGKTEILQIPDDIILTSRIIADQIYLEFSAQDDDFKLVYGQWNKFRTSINSLWDITEYAYLQAYRLTE